MTTLRYVIEGTQYQGSNETAVPYALYDVTNQWGGGVVPTTPTATISTVDPVTKALTDVTATKMSGAASVSGNDIILPVVSALVEGTLYRVRVSFYISSALLSVPFDIMCEY